MHVCRLIGRDLSVSAISNQNNKARLQLLEKREELLEKVFDEARAKIGDVTKDQKKYSELLKNLILQASPSARLAALKRKIDPFAR